MEFGDMFYTSVTGEVGTQDLNKVQKQIRVQDHLTTNSKMVMNEDGTCDVEGSVKITHLQLKSLMQLTPRIGKVTGDFLCSNILLTSLVGAPKEVGGDFDCYENQLPH